MITFGQAFKNARSRANLTQKDIADFLGYDSAQLISNIERGLCYPPIKSLKRVSKKYGFNYETLAGLAVVEKYERLKKEWLT